MFLYNEEDTLILLKVSYVLGTVLRAYMSILTNYTHTLTHLIMCYINYKTNIFLSIETVIKMLKDFYTSTNYFLLTEMCVYCMYDVHLFSERSVIEYITLFLKILV